MCLSIPENDDETQRKQELLKQLMKPKKGKDTRYYDHITAVDFAADSSEDDANDESEDEADFNGLKIKMNVDNDNDDDEDEDEEFLAIEDSAHSADASDDDEDSDSNSECDPDELAKFKKAADDALCNLSKLEFEKLLSHTMLNLAHKLELSEQEKAKSTGSHSTVGVALNPFITMDDEISLETNTGINMKELLSFIPDIAEDVGGDNGGNEEGEDSMEITGESINNPSDFTSIVALEQSHCLLPDPTTKSSNHPSNLRTSKLNNVTLSHSSLSDRDQKQNSFLREEIRLAQRTMNQAITRRTNIERKNFAPPLSQKDPRTRRKRKRENAGKGWFNMPAGRLTPENKMHFLMLKYRHMLYRKHKPTKMKEQFVPKFFQMGTVIEGPTEFYSDRLLKRERRKSWADEYLNNPETRKWFRVKKSRARRRIRAPENTFWAPMKQLGLSNRYKLKKQMAKSRKQTMKQKGTGPKKGKR